MLDHAASAAAPAAATCCTMLAASARRRQGSAPAPCGRHSGRQNSAAVTCRRRGGARPGAAIDRSPGRVPARRVGGQRPGHWPTPGYFGPLCGVASGAARPEFTYSGNLLGARRLRPAAAQSVCRAPRHETDSLHSPPSDVAGAPRLGAVRGQWRGERIGDRAAVRSAPPRPFRRQLPSATLRRGADGGVTELALGRPRVKLP